jgi:nicotinamidase-related amidase
MSRALLVIDVQNDYFSGPHEITHPEGSFAGIQRAMDVAHAHGVPIVLIQQTFLPPVPIFCKGTPGWEIPAELLSRPHDIVIEKGLPGSFTGTNLEAWLRERDVDTVVICGYMTQMCCDTTSRQAVHLGFNVEFLSNATGTHAFSTDAGSVTAEELHRATLVVQSSRFAKVMTVEAWDELLSADTRQ